MTKFGNDLLSALQEMAAFSASEPNDVVIHEVHVPDDVDVRAIRKRLKLNRADFAARFGLASRTVQEWEQGRRRPDRTARVLLRTIERHPEAVDDALAAA